MDEEQVEEFGMFQSLIGILQTLKKFRTQEKEINVSIPHRYSTNRKLF